MQSSGFRLPAATAVGGVEAFRARSREIVGEDCPEKVELGALWLWERAAATSNAPSAVESGPAEPALKPQAGALTGYLSALGACLGNYSGALAPALLEAGKAFRPELLLERQESNGFHYLGGSLSHNDLLSLGQQIEGGPRYCAGVPCTGTWSETEQKAIATTLEKLRNVAPGLYPKLKGIVVQTWLGSDKPEFLLAPGAGGTFNSSSPGVLQIQRSSLKPPSELERVLFHEFGHAVDANGQGNYRSAYDGPFGAHREKRYCVSDYATTAPHEDFAETFGFCVKHFDKMQQHPDIYFHGLGPLSEKFKYVFEKTLGREVPPPSPRWQQLKADLAAGNSPFGWKSSAGQVEQANPELRQALRDIALNWDLDKPDANLQYATASRSREQREFLAHRLLGGKAPTGLSPLPGVDDLAEQLGSYAQVTSLRQERDERLSRIKQQCGDLVRRGAGLEEIPLELCDQVGLAYGQMALPLRSKMDELDAVPPQQWAQHLLDGSEDSVLKERLRACHDPAELRDLASRRSEELIGLFSALKERGKGTPQASDVIREQTEPATTRAYQLSTDLRATFEACGRHLEKHLTAHLQATGRQDLLSVFHELQPKP